MSGKHDEDTTLLAKSIILHDRDGNAAERGHYLLVVEGEERGRRIPLGHSPVVIGRSAPADIVIADPRASRNHCRVCVAMDEVIVIDLQSSNGSFIDGKRLSGGGPLAVGSRLQVGSHVFEHEWRIRKEVEASQELDRDIDQAWQYIQALLPAPMNEGPIRSDWVLEPCARLGGDAFGYRYLDPGYFATYLIDVSGHGTGAAMHAVSVINVLRQNVLPAEDYRDPARVLTALNAMFRMETHGNLYFTVWYGVFDLETRVLDYACGGHHPSYLVDSARDRAIPLRTRNPVIGVAPEAAFRSDAVVVPPGAMLYVFSDGVYEITTKYGVDWNLEDFEKAMIKPPAAGVDESRRLLELVRASAKSPALDDDFSLIAFTFPEESAVGRAPDSTWPNRG